MGGLTQFDQQVDQDLLADLEGDWEISCEIPDLIRKNGNGFPCCAGDPARWVAWRVHCCNGMPPYLLVCDFCKSVYQRWRAQQAAIFCAHCHRETGGPHTFTPLNRGKA